MTRKVVAVAPDTPFSEIIKLLVERQVSGVPVVSVERLPSGDRERGRPDPRLGKEGAQALMVAHLLALPADAGQRVSPKSHGRLASDVMTREVVSITLDTPLPEIARLAEAPDRARTGTPGQRAPSAS